MLKYLIGSKFNSYLKWLWIAMFSGIALFILFVFMVSWEWFDKLPALEELENPKTLLASEIYAEDGVVIGKYYLQNRSPVSYQEISPNMINALVATEDFRFYDHSGIDFQRFTTALLFLGTRGGASTITQQLAKNLFPRKRFNNVFQKATTKIKEWITAIRIEERYTKEEIITMYLNTVEFGGNSFGINSAAKTFFGKSPGELNLQEAAMLVGMLKAPTKYSPVRNPANALGRRNTVLGQMLKYDVINQAAFDTLKLTPIELKYKEEDHNDGLAPYFREYLRQELLTWCEENGYNLYKDGLKIYTTINSKLQTLAEEAVHSHVKEMQKKFYEHWQGREPWGQFKELITQAMKRSDRYRILKNAGLSEAEIEKSFNTPVKMKVFSYTRGEIDTVMTPLDSIKYYKYFMQCGLMSMDPTTGFIKAWVGGVNHKYFKYDHVNINAKRQVGSTFKPLVYTLAIDNGWSPCYKAPNQRVVFEDYENYSPDNADDKYNEPEMTLYRGLQFSVNNIVMHVMKQLGPTAPNSVIELARKMGIKSELPPYPSIALGVADISVYEMVGAFSTYANKGVWTEPIFITRIEDKNGNLIREIVPKRVEAMSEQTAYIMEKMLERVTAHGTAAKVKYLYQVPGAVGGKTGTTQNYSDGWFIGITPYLATGVWTGFEDRAIHFRSMSLGSGSAMAMPIFGKFMNKALSDTATVKVLQYWQPPNTPLNVEINCDQYESSDPKKLQLIEE
ncbi:MAG: transglycosylase domain-containing protein [Bacteroidia bacterium]|jgi:penicillin-binding protein 1A|nr:transglycosylase domain-containing protein [Bacteroidia bacterium]